MQKCPRPHDSSVQDRMAQAGSVLLCMLRVRLAMMSTARQEGMKHCCQPGKGEPLLSLHRMLERQSALHHQGPAVNVVKNE